MYYFMNKNVVLAELSYKGSFHIVNRCNIDSVLLYMLRSDVDINKWVTNRVTPIGRVGALNLYKQAGIVTDKDFVDVSMCLSVTDTFWISNGGAVWEDVSLFRNPFSKVYTEIAMGLRGFNGYNVRTPSPELSIGGCSMKCLKKGNAGIYLYKTFGSMNELFCSGAFSEYFACQVAKYLGYNCVDYDLCELNDMIVSRCKLFTSEAVGLVEIDCLCDDYKHIDEHLRHYRGVDLKQMCDMLILDAIVLNVDRHGGNFGMLFDTDTLQIIGVAPVYDLDHALLPTVPLVGKSDAYIMESVRCCLPKTYNDHTFVEQARYCMYEGLRSFDSFSLKQHKKYKVSDERLNKLTRIIKWQVRQIQGV